MMEKDKSLDQSLNIGSEIRLFDGCIKTIRIGTVKTIREIRQLMKGVNFKFSFCIGRDVTELSADPTNPERTEKIDFPAMENKYKQAFNIVLEEGLTDEEYDKIDDNGIEELDTLLDRFL